MKLLGMQLLVTSLKAQLIEKHIFLYKPVFFCFYMKYDFELQVEVKSV